MVTAKICKTAAVLIALGCVLPLAGCGGSGGGDSDTGTLTLNITDAPVTGAVNVVVEFIGVEVKPESGEALNFTFDPRQIDLLALAGGGSEILLQEELPAGTYNWVKVNINADPASRGSYIDFTDNESSEDALPLEIPSGDTSGLKLNRHFDVPHGGSAEFTIDFNLTKSVREAGGDYKLQPSLRIVDNSQIGSITGTVAGLEADAVCSVYLFEGADVTPDDMDEVEGDDAEPITMATVEYDEQDDQHHYTATFLSAGEYTVAVTCDDDDPGADEVLSFTTPVNVTVVADVEAVQPL